MIQEDYVSSEIAKLLKEKGFDEICFAVWRYWEDSIGKPCFINSLSMVDEKGYPYCYNSRLKKSENDGEIDIACPTLQMAMKWLREVHSLVIEPYRTACGYLYTVSNVPYGSTKYNNGDAYNGDDENSGQWTTWEKACEDGIKYCLENLI